MDSSNINIKDKYKRPGVIGEKSSCGDSGDNEMDSLLSDGPYRGDQSARGLASKKVVSKPQESQEQYRIVITKEANDCLGEAVEKVNRGLTGAVARSDLANYVFLNLARLLSDADLKAVKALHFDEKKVLGTILKSDEDLPEELRRALREHYGISEVGKKRTLRVAPTLASEAADADPGAA